MLISYKTYITQSYCNSSIAPKGFDVFLNVASNSPNGSFSASRILSRTSDTSYSADNAAFSVGTGAGTQDNNRIIPIAIYGFKKNIEFDLTAVVADVSTSADKCMLSDGVTSVEDAIDKGSVTVTGDGTKTIAALFTELYTLIDHSKLNSNSLMLSGSNVFHLQSITNSTITFSRVDVTISRITSTSAHINGTSSTYIDAITNSSGTTITDYSSVVLSSTDFITIQY